MEDSSSNGIADDLLFRCLEGTATGSEYEQAWRQVHQSAHSKARYAAMRDAWIAAGLLKPVDVGRQKRIWIQLEQKMQQGKVSGKTIRRGYLKWAAAGAVAVLAYLSGTQTPLKRENRDIAAGEYAIEAPKGGKSVMTLSDGSKVWLNAGSTLHFDKSFGEQNRTLTLQGEAYFEVVRDAGRPFLVKAPGITIAALGTAFNVKAYPGEDLIEATLVEGSVRIETGGQSTPGAGPIVLEPGQKAVFFKSRQSATVAAKCTDDSGQNNAAADESDTLQSFSRIEIAKDVDVEVSTSWKDKRWIVLGERLGALAAKIERKYDMTLFFEDAELKDYKISATLEEETVEQLLNAIRLTVPMDYRIERDQVHLKMNSQLKKKYDRLIQNK